ncbi:hypothetical protein EYF80_066330 [Liparis tanakae]|uniref:Uncharacterized protein n=1 Tax=Liparis tanakae TaxID=230148 RepID=A0A4Z2E456_9TELE|nr:hypothetical protein EYF80_066330 [Liparis tanakae]
MLEYFTCFKKSWQVKFPCSVGRYFGLFQVIFPHFIPFFPCFFRLNFAVFYSQQPYKKTSFPLQNKSSHQGLQECRKIHNYTKAPRWLVCVREVIVYGLNADGITAFPSLIRLAGTPPQSNNHHSVECHG